MIADCRFTCDELPLGSSVIGRCEIKSDGAILQCLVFVTPDQKRVACYLDRKNSVFRTIEIEV